MNRNLFNQIVTVILLSFSLVLSNEDDVEDKTLSPYFHVQSRDSNVVDFPLLSTTADVNIAGVIADVTVSQRYVNKGSSPIEAIYVFPASTRAAVYTLKMELGERIINAIVKKRQEARADYEQAKNQGQSAALLEQQRPNVFQMNVANIMPGDTIDVTLKYTELLVPNDNIYEFVYPTVVGPRYSNTKPSEEKSIDKWVSNPYLKQGEKPPYTFDIKIGVNAGMPIQEIECGTHKVIVHYNDNSSALVRLDNNELAGGNRDFILKYRLAGDQIQSGVLLYKGEKENFFCMMVHPPKNVTNKNIPSREYIFVVDVSGSMDGFPLEISKVLLKNLLSGLRLSDCFNVVLFAGSSMCMAKKSLPATEENISKAIQVIDFQKGGGGTELLPALQTAMTLPRTDTSSRSVVVVTDGNVDFEVEAFELIRNNLGKANLFAFGIGSSVNRFLIEGISHAGGGTPFIVTNPQKGTETAELFRKYIQNPVLTNISCTFDGFSVYDVEPVGIPDVMSSRPIIVFGKWKGAPSGKINVRGLTGNNGKYSQEFSISQSMLSGQNRALQYLWARQKITLLGDYYKLAPDDKRVNEITTLGLDYNLLTEFTSFIAIDENERNKDGELRTVKQPLPLPLGVSNLAIAEDIQYQMARSQKASGTQIKCIKNESEKIDKELEALKRQLEQESRIELTDTSMVMLTEKTVIYYWDSATADIVKEIRMIIKIAAERPEITFILINNNATNAGSTENLYKDMNIGYTIPGNVLFVQDPSKNLNRFADGYKSFKRQPTILFTIHHVVVRSFNQCQTNIWIDPKIIDQQFKK